MNTQVTATGMQIKAKSNNTFLLINTGDNDTAAEIQTAGVTTIAVTVSDEQAEVFPSKPKEASEIGSGKRFESGTPVTNASTAAAAGNWYTAHNNNPANANDSVKSINSLNTTSGDTYEFAKYVIKRTVYLTLAKGSDDAHNLTVTPTITMKDTYAKTTDTALNNSKTYYTQSGETYTAVSSPDVANIATYYEKANNIEAVKVLVATGDNYAILSSSTTTAQSLYATTNQDLKDSTVVTVDIYIYYDGEATPVYTNNILNLSAATIQLAFDVAVK